MIGFLFNNIFFNIFLLGACFFVLFKSADYFVEAAVGFATHWNVPQMLVGILIVGFATTAPEIAVSAQAAYLGHPEIAFGNAIGSVIVDDGVALALAGIVASTPIMVNKNILRTAGVFLIIIDVIAFFFSKEGIISRIEGAALISLLVLYILFVMYMEKKRRIHLMVVDEELTKQEGVNLKRLVFMFLAGLGGVVLSSRGVIHSAEFIARYLHVSETIIALTIIAIGTSLPEISTCIVASLKGHGEIAVGDIIGADILNILWIIGVSALIRPIELEPFTVFFSFISMFIVVGATLTSLWIGYRLHRKKSIVLLFLYLIYLYFNYRFFYGG